MMRQPYTASIALRYLRSRARTAFISFISAISMLGIALAVAVLIVVMAVINGFETELERRILSVMPDARMFGHDGRTETPVDNWPELLQAALDRADVREAAPFVEGQGMVIAGGDLYGVTLRGVDPDLEPGVSSIHERVVSGNFDALADNDAIVIGSGLAEALGVAIGDRIVVMLSRAQVTPAGIVPRLKAFEVAGVFDVGMQEYDRGLALVSFEMATRLFRTGGRASGIALRVDDRYRAPAIVSEFAVSMRDRFETGYSYEDWSSRHANVFRSIELTKPMLFIMLSLVIVIAAFNIVSTLFMVVREKTGDIAILRSIGSTPRNILDVFVIQGSSIGLIGMLGGLALGLVLVAGLGTVVGWVESWFAIDLLSADVYLIGDLPTEARPLDVARVCLLAFGLAVAATLYPAYRASRQPPAEALRHE